MRLVPKMIEAATTTTANTEPRMAERTGATSGPAPEPKAQRMPVVAEGPKPGAAATRDEGRNPLGASASRPGVTVRGGLVRREDRSRA